MCAQTKMIDGDEISPGTKWVFSNEEMRKSSYQEKLGRETHRHFHSLYHAKADTLCVCLYHVHGEGEGWTANAHHHRVNEGKATSRWGGCGGKVEI